VDKLTGTRAQFYDPRAESDAVAVDTGSETLVQQSFKEEVDVNTIARRFGVTSSMALGPGKPMYGDFTGITDFDSAVALVDGARKRFGKLPAELREEFGNDPANLVRFASSSTPEEFEEFFAPEPAPGGEAPPAPPGTP